MSAALYACGGSPPPSAPVSPPSSAVPPPPPAPPPAEVEAPAPPRETAKMTGADAARITLAAYVEAMRQHDAKRVAGLFTEDATFAAAGRAPSKGRAEIARRAQTSFDTFSTLRFASTRILVHGEKVAHEWSMTGTHSGDFLGVKATEKPIGVNGVSLLVLDADSGLVKEQRDYVDNATILAQVGTTKNKVRSIPVLSSSAEWKVSNGSPDEQAAVDLWKRLIASINDRNESDYMALQADDVAYDDLTQRATVRGHVEAQKWFTSFTASFAEAKATQTDTWAAEDYVVSENVVVATAKGAKKAMTAHVVDIGQVKGGKVVHGWSYGDGTELVAVPDALPPKNTKK